MIPTKYIILLPIIISLVNVSNASAGDNKPAVVEIDLEVDTRYVTHSVVLGEPVVKSAIAKDYAVFASNRSLWVTRDGKKFSTVDIKYGNKDDIWLGGLCVAGRKIVIAVSLYPEEQRQKELASALGAFRRGPQALGFMIFDGHSSRLVSNFKVTAASRQVHQDYKAMSADGKYSLPESVVPYIQSCQWDGRHLWIGDYGSLLKINLENDTAILVENDIEMEFNRSAMMVKGKELWVLKDEGGAGGGCIDHIVSGKTREYCILGFNNNIVRVDSIIDYQGRVFTSSLAGVVEIDVNRNRYNHYKISPDKSKMRVYLIRQMDQHLWGLLEDGWISFNLRKSRAVKYRLSGKVVSNDIYVLQRYKGKLYVSNGNALMLVSEYQ
jgi:hypothetical protein